MACLSVVVNDQDAFGDAVCVGQSVIPIGPKEEPTLHSGYRSVQLHNLYGHEILLASVLLHVTMEYRARGESIVPSRGFRHSRKFAAPVDQQRAAAVSSGEIAAAAAADSSATA
mmetsp:Transcript_1010/g.3384  ORF Transcript_1010/g.3384 Transcript_1010/m.3384 type:complete len:114 (-) Transcript_1010:85-426(-)